MKSSRIIAGTTVVCSLMVIAACSSGSAATGSNGTASTAAGTQSAPGAASLAAVQAAANRYLRPPNAIGQTVPLPKAPPKNEKIIVVGTSEPTNVQDQQAIKAADSALGWTTTVIDYDPTNTATLEAAFNNALIEHPAAVVEAGLPQTQFGASVLSAYAKAKVPIAIIGAYPFTPSKYIIGEPDGYANDVRMGKALADWFIANSDGHGQVLMEHVPSYPILDAFTVTFQQTLAKYCPSCAYKEVDVTLAEVGAGQAASVVAAAAKANPDYKYIFFDDGDFAIGINSALSAAGITGKTIGGEALDVEGAAALRSGTQAAWTGFSGFYSGYAVVDVIARYIEGVPGAANDVVQPTQLLTPQNIGQVTTWNEPADALAQFEKLWHVGS